MLPIGIAGAGRIACALGRLLRECGQPVAAIASRTSERAEAAARFIGGACRPVPYDALGGIAPRLLIAVSDDALRDVALTLAPGCGRQTAALHTCGRYGADALAALRDRGASCGSLHPLQTVAAPEQGVLALPGSAIAVDGEGAARTWALEIACLLNGTVLAVEPGRRGAYHAAAVMASNCITGLLDAAAALMETAGVEPAVALQALAPLARTALDNAVAFGPARALTGPVERGDTGTVRGHLEALTAAPAAAAALYRAASLYLVQLARERNPGRDYEEMQRVLEDQNG